MHILSVNVIYSLFRDKMHTIYILWKKENFPVINWHCIRMQTYKELKFYGTWPLMLKIIIFIIFYYL